MGNHASKKWGFFRLLEGIAIVILIISFLVLAYCLYISIKVEQDYGNSTVYETKRTSSNEIVENKDN